jgi:hypothetical protein
LHARRRLWISVVVALGIGAAVTFCWPWGAAVPPAPRTEVAVGDVQDGSADAVRERAGAAADAPASSTAVDAATPGTREGVAVPDPALARLRGRCVDEHGKALAGCVVRLHGWTGNQSRMEQWMLDHAEPPAWTDPDEITTGEDGRFEVAFGPPPPLQFSLSVSAEGRAAMGGRWGELAPGQVIDFGDVAMVPGVVVVGRVVDQRDVPVASVNVNLIRAQRQDAPAGASGPLAPLDLAAAQSQADGTFRVHQVLASGTFEVATTGRRRLERPKEITLDAALRSVEQIVVVVVEPDASMQITGTVLDDAGDPVPQVTVAARNVDESHTSTVTRRDGTFALSRPDGWPDGKVRLRLEAEHHDVPEPTLADVAWGTAGLEFRVVRTGELLVRVCEPKGRPVEVYTLRLVPRKSGRLGSTDGEARSQGHHEDGLARITGVTSGDWLLVLEFPDASGWQPLFHAFSHEAGGQRRIDLTAVAPVTQPLRVVTASGEPVAGSNVVLGELQGAPFTELRALVELREWVAWPSEQSVPILFRGTTDEGGRVELRGAADRELGLALLGPGHLPKRTTVRLGGGGEQVVVVDVGARIVGRVVPPEALVELRRLANVRAEGSFAPHLRPRVELNNAQGWRFPVLRAGGARDESFDVRDDGTFDAQGLPPGAWQVAIRYGIDQGNGASNALAGARDVTLVDGQRMTLELDLSGILPGTLVGKVLCDGVPAASRWLSLIARHSRSNVMTDEHGEFTYQGVPGEYRLVLQVPDGARHVAELASAMPAVIVRGETTRQTFSLASCRLTLTVTGPDGLPRAGVRVQVERDPAPSGPRSSPVFLPATLEDGSTEGLVGAENVVLRIARDYVDAAGAKKVRWIDLERLALQPGQDRTVAVRLPAD